MNDRLSRSVIEQEKAVVAQMVAIYCRGKHGTRRGELCTDCRALLDYAYRRLDRCPYGEDKGFCSDCPIHCYKPDRRAEIARVMRYSGWRMLWYAPRMALAHLWRRQK